MRNPGVVLTRHTIEDEIWDDEITEGSNTVDVYVGYLRRKLESDNESRVLHTVRGTGFVLRVGGDS
jgi:DNA-binding response OmpR family regulator